MTTDLEFGKYQRIPHLITNRLRNFNVPGIYAIINESDRKVDVRHSTNCIQAIIRHLTQIWDDTHPVRELAMDKEKLFFVLLEDVKDPTQRLLAHTRFTDYFEDRGYTFYRHRPALRYYTRIRPVRISRLRLQVRVYLITGNHDETVVGCFDSMPEAKEFVKEYYSNGSIYFSIYAVNAPTREYYQKIRTP